MLRTIHLHGSLRDLAAVESIELAVETPTQLVLALRSVIKGFRAYCDQHKVALAYFENGKPVALTQEDFNFRLGSITDIHIVPETAGAFGEAIVAAIANGAYWTAAYYIALNIVIYVAAAYAVSALAPSPDVSGGVAKAEERPSFLYNGPENVVEQGYAVPIIYGAHMTGSVVVSAGIEVEDIPYVTAEALTDPTQPANPTVQFGQFVGA